MLVADGGGTLFKDAVPPLNETEREKRKEQAQFIAKTLAATSLAAMNAGRTELSEGKGFLEEIRRAANLPLVSANLRSSDGQRLFPSSRTVHWGSLKAVLFGLTKPDPAADRALGIRIDDPAAAAKEIIANLKPGEIAICLTDLGYDGEHALAREVPGIALIVGGGDGIKSLSAPIPIRETILLRAADRGRELGVLDIHGMPEDGWKLPANRARNEETKKQLENLKKAVSQTAPSGSALIGGTVESLDRELDSPKKDSQGPEFINRLIHLDSSVPDDPSVAAAISRLTSKYQKPAETKPAVPSPPAKRPWLAPRDDDAPGFGKGAITCRKCHEKAYSKWLETGHSRSQSRLPYDKRGDQGCLKCHGTVLKLPRGQAVEPMVGCEACHGPGSAHPGKGLVKKKVDVKTCAACHGDAHGKPPMDAAREYGRIRCDR